MCRNIRLLHNMDPPTTPEEIADAALQFVRKVSGTRAPSRADKEAFDRAVELVAAATTDLLATLHARGPAHTREEMREKAHARWTQRQARSRSI
jgi:hypothetical protein